MVRTSDYVGCGVVIEDFLCTVIGSTLLERFHCRSCRYLRALQLTDSNMPRKYCIYTDSMSVLEALENYNDRCHPVVCKISTIRVACTARVSISCLLATESRRNHRQRASGQRGKVGDDPSAASSSAIGYEARHPASYFYDLAGIMGSAVG
ncbi:pggt1b [Trichonephila clavipes]|nr:pggt1b [Trichonephila clavipes]